MTFTIRPALEADIPAMARIWNEINPNHACTVETFAREMQEAREHPLGLHNVYWVVADAGGTTVAYASVEQYGGMFHQDRYHAYVQVLPQGRGQGIGKALADVLREHLHSRGAREVIGGAYDNEPAAAPLLARYGLSECQRYFDSHLDVTAFDFAAWDGKEALPAGLRMVAFSELMQAGEDKAWRTFFDLHCDTILDVPAPSARTLPTFEDFQKRFNDPNFIPDALFLVLDENGQALAYSILWRKGNESDHWKIGITSVRREWRRHGLALALKLRGIRLAQDSGIRTMTTNAESGNAPMLRLNERLGFKNDLAYVEYKWGGV